MTTETQSRPTLMSLEVKRLSPFRSLDSKSVLLYRWWIRLPFLGRPARGEEIVRDG